MTNFGWHLKNIKKKKGRTWGSCDGAIEGLPF